MKVTIIGGTGSIGQPLGMLLKTNPKVTQLGIYDVQKATRGVAVDLSHINTSTAISSGRGRKEIHKALKGAHVVVVSAGMPCENKGMSREDLFQHNADIMFEVMHAIAAFAPYALIAIVMNPVNSIMPLASEYMKKACIYDPKRIFGVTTLNLVRAATFVGNYNLHLPEYQFVPVIGGQSGETIVPLLSRASPPLGTRNHDVVYGLTKAIQGANDEVVKVKNGKSATLSTAFAAERFVDSLLNGLLGHHVIDYAYVNSNEGCNIPCDCPDGTQATFFAGPVVLGPSGVHQYVDIGQIEEREEEMVKKAVPQIIKDIKIGVDYIKAKASKISVHVNPHI